jgi:hypothetical protein
MLHTAKKSNHYLRPHFCPLPSPKNSPTQNLNHSRQKSEKLPWQALGANCQPYHIKAHVEQRPQHRRRKIYIKIFYLTAPLDRYKYMKMPILLFLYWIIKQYDLLKHNHHRFIYLEMHCAVWGLPQAGILANKLLQKRLLPHRYYECANTPGLWKHKTRQILFTLFVDNFGIKYVGKDHVYHLIWCIKQKYELTKDWTSILFFTGEYN